MFFNKIISYDTEQTPKLTILLFLLIVLILSRSIGFYSLNQYILMCICCISLLCTTYKECKYLLFFLLPLSCALQAFTISIGVLILYLKSPKKSFGNLAPFILLISLELIHLLNATNVTIVDFLYYSTYLFTFFYLLSDGDTTSSPRFCTKMFCYGLMVSLFAVIYGMIDTYGIVGAFSGLYRDGSVIGKSSNENAVGVSLNANSVAYYSLALISIILCNQSKLKISRFLITAGIIISMLAGIISFSRTWIILLSLFILIVFFLTSQKKAFLIAFLAALIIIPSFSGYSDITNGYSQRFQSEDIQTAGNRQGITRFLFNYLNDNPSAYIWGVGVLTYEEYTQQAVSPHNATQQILVCTGLLGLLIFTITIYKYGRKNFLRNRDWISLLPFFICLLEIQTIQFLSPHFLLFPIIGTMYCMKPELEQDVSAKK